MTLLDLDNTMSSQRISPASSQLLNNSKAIHSGDPKRNAFNFQRLSHQDPFINYALILDFMKKESHAKIENDPRKIKTVLHHSKKLLQCGKLINKLKMGMYPMIWKRQHKPCQRKS